MYYFIEFLRAIATALVANSHFKGVWPSDILSFGGGYGVALFFMISGYLLSNIGKDTRFYSWFFFKVVRLYVPLYIVRLFELVFKYTTIKNLKSFILEFVFPGTWFGGALIIAYILYYVAVKHWLKGEKSNKALILVGIGIVCYILLFIFKPQIASFDIKHMIFAPFDVENYYLICQTIWFSCMIFGYWIKICKVNIRNSIVLIVLFSISVLAFLGVKLATRNGTNLNAEIALGPIYFIFSSTLFLLLSKAEEWCKKVWTTPFGKVVKIVSASSLEIFYIQFIWIAFLKDLVFPLNLLLLIVLIVVSGYIVHVLAGIIMKRILCKMR